MADSFARFTLSQWQREFADSYLAAPKVRSLLVAPVGTGKTVMSLYVAQQMLNQGIVDATLFLSDHRALTEQWRHAAGQFGLTLTETLESHSAASSGVAATVQSVRRHRDPELVAELATNSRWFLVLDEAHQLSRPVIETTNRFLALNSGSKALYLSQQRLSDLPFDAEFRFGTEFIFRRSLLESPRMEERIRVHAPSFGLLRKLQRKGQRLDGLTWRQFEKLIAELLETDGYEVQLMRGTKDGGVDVIATKDLGVSGHFRGLWQAKKLAGSRRVGISTIRELADTRDEFGASKGLIVTSTFLTKGALERVERDRYTLGKVDRKDLDAWIARILRGERL